MQFSNSSNNPMRNLSLLFCLIIFVVNPANAARISADYLLQVCASDEQGNEIVEGGHTACQGYIAGVLDYHNLIRSLGTSPSVDFCVPDGVSMEEIQSRIVAYIFRNQHEQGPFIAAPGVALALYKAYPCK